jgi:hypothetical protein
MKTTITCYALFLCITYATAQNLSIEKTDAGDEITFRITREVNVNYYVIEGTDDNINFDILVRLNVKGNDLGPINYDFLYYGKGYLHYLVKQIDMSGSCVSEIGDNPEAAGQSNVRCHVTY